MTDVLGYRRFAAQGGDWGAFVTACLGAAHRRPPRRHPRQPARGDRRDVHAGDADDDEERATSSELAHWMREETGLPVRSRARKPQTLAYGLTDSPAGLAAWIVEKFRTWSDCGGDVERRFSKDVLLTNVMLYWVTGAINSSFWPYYARRHEPWPITERSAGRACRRPTPRSRARSCTRRARGPSASTDIRRWTVMPAGGHFAALEEPEALAADIRAFFRDLR